MCGRASQWIICLVCILRSAKFCYRQMSIKVTEKFHLRILATYVASYSTMLCSLSCLTYVHIPNLRVEVIIILLEYIILNFAHCSYRF